MTLEQSQTAEATESQAHYSPEEAGEILRIAAHLQDNTITAEQLRAIAREAGVSDENLERAIQQYERSRWAETQKKQKRSANKRRVLVWLSALAIATTALLMLVPVRHETSAAAPQVSDIDRSGATVLASSNAITVYKVEKSDGEMIIIQRSDGYYSQEFVVGVRFQEAHLASISPSGEHVMLYDSQTGEIWTIGTDGHALQRVARAGELLQYGNEYTVVDENNPFAGWYASGDTDVLMIRLRDGRTASVHLSAE